ncbi:hypothetical protein GEV33_007354 [Tenebrio molitor]|uniref:Uncharacterized protein n=1 Tax=Tenebrio molitor TaxID=7067 RepID=A0A8J6LC81_TENMO|nr:hypothetical protein GEV33_007354 [Tenebrio molitor]
MMIIFLLYVSFDLFLRRINASTPETLIKHPSRSNPICDSYIVIFTINSLSFQRQPCTIDPPARPIIAQRSQGLRIFTMFPFPARNSPILDGTRGKVAHLNLNVHLEAALIPETGGTRVMRRDYSRCALVDVETLRHPRRYCQFGNQDCVTDCRWCGGAARNALAPSVQKYRRVGEEDGDCQVDESAI